jgi:hypothetical protein
MEFIGYDEWKTTDSSWQDPPPDVEDFELDGVQLELFPEIAARPVARTCAWCGARLCAAGHRVGFLPAVWCDTVCYKAAEQSVAADLGW